MCCWHKFFCANDKYSFLTKKYSIWPETRKGIKMNIDKSSFVGKLFFLALKICEAFTGRTFAYKYEKGTNLCHFVRVTFFYLPAIISIQGAFWVYISNLLLIIPIKKFGFGGFFITIACTIVTILVFAFLIIGLGILADKIPRLIKRKELETDNTRPTVQAIFIAWIKAKKQKICPLINFEEGTKNA